MAVRLVAVISDERVRRAAASLRSRRVDPPLKRFSAYGFALGGANFSGGAMS